MAVARKKTPPRRPAPAAAAGLPARLERLARNLWWTWNSTPQRVFSAIDPTAWEATRRNPVATLLSASPQRIAQLTQDDAFCSLLAEAEQQLADYLATPTWFARSARGSQGKLRVAYFCSEYSLHECMPQYAGGLGVLAGDHLKSASDLGVPLVGVGLLYRSGYYEQSLNRDGTTRVLHPQYDFGSWPIENTGCVIEVPIGRQTVHAQVWQVVVGRTLLLLLDSDVPQNTPASRKITDRLYQGDPLHRAEQQILLGVGGLYALDALGIAPNVFHLNEGHAAFCGLERMRRLCAQGRSVAQATAEIRASTVFTTHTPVPAGHDRYEPTLMARLFAPLAAECGLSRRELLALGRERGGDESESFCMTVLALKLAKHCNGVAALHGATSRAMWQSLYGAAQAEDVPIRHVTNGIHCQTWLAPEIEPLYARRLKPRWAGAGPDDDWWRNAERIPPAELWAVRNNLRAKLITFIRARLSEQIQRRVGPIDDLIAAHETFRDDALTIGFARRFATYKRAPLVFRDARRLAKIVNDARRPVQLVFAGKAHPADAGGQAFAQQVHQQAQAAGFRGRVVLLENYDMHIGRMLTSGCDVWLNNPLRPMEASGTSGMKPCLHGGVNCSILDGWWPEAYDGTNGWAIGDGRELRSQAAQDRYDANCIYELLEKEIVPLFYERGRDGLPRGWLRMAARSMSTVCRRFSGSRMLADYTQEYYWPALA